ncbi:DNA-binding response regulator, OmpR family, contains REC and winged-helix (wHTH) domain [Ruminococcaceae bacterium YAD3003]|nr:DNA-binding response regulator, OmpR family, contains REC and winged-helix (wHTH) domain [Ruminococcaceae bacterium YAD3003]
MSRILIVEDDEDIGAVLQKELLKDGYEVLRATTGTEGRIMLGQSPDLILMDLMLPGLSGEELLTHIPEDTPVIAVSARSSIDDKISLLSKGCVDYITKPFDIRELKARVTAALRTTSRKEHPGRISCGEMLINTDKHEVTIEGKELKLTRTEYAILKMLASAGGRVISKSELLDLIKSETPDCTDSSVKVHISNLRKKIKTLTETEYIEAVWGIGFKLKGDQ